jgi:hypothetical protein
MLITKIRNIFDYRIFALGNHNDKPNETEVSLNSLLKGYPRNHNYDIRNNNLYPSFKLYERLKKITKLYPENLKSFLDIGCCRGFFVMDAAKGHHCQRSVGIDVHEPFISTSEKVKRYLDIDNATFYLASLDEIAENSESYGGPFQTILLTGAYHYLFWGSELCSDAHYSHEQIFHKLSAVCSGRLIISGRFEVNRLTHQLKEMVKSDEKNLIYDTASVLKAASLFFKIRRAGCLGKDPLFVMMKKK